MQRSHAARQAEAMSAELSGFRRLLAASAAGLVALLLGLSGQVQASSGSDARLVETYREMLADDPNHEYALERLLEVAHGAGGVSALVTDYRQELKKKPRSYARWMVLGHLLLASDRHDEALAAYERASEIAPKRAEPVHAKARLLKGLARWKGALTAFDMALERTRGTSRKQELLREAVETAVEASSDVALERYAAALVATQPRSVDLRMQLAALLGRAGKLDRSLATWRDAERLARGRLSASIIIDKEMALLQQRAGDLVAAEAAWRRGLKRLSKRHYERPTFLLGLLGVYRQQDRLSELLTELAPQMKRDHAVTVAVARIHEELSDRPSAIAAYRQAIELQRADQESRLALIRLVERSGTPSQLIAEYEALIAASPAEPRFEIKLAELLLRQGKFKRGHGALVKIARRYSRDAGVQTAIVELLHQHGGKRGRQELERAYKQLVKLEPDDDGHVVSLGQHYWSTGDKPKARKTWKRLEKLGRNRAEGRFFHAEVLADHDLFDAAWPLYRAAHEAQPDNKEFIRGYATALERAGRVTDAVALWEQVGERATSVAGGTRLGGEARKRKIALWQSSRRLTRERRRLEKAFGASPRDLGVGHLLASVYEHERRYEESVQVLEKLLGAHPKDEETLLALADSYTRLQRLTDGIATLEALAGVDASGAAGHMLRAATLAVAASETARANALLAQVVALKPRDRTTLEQLGDLYSRLGRSDEAISAWRDAAHAEPSNASLSFKLAAIYASTGDAVRHELTLMRVLRESREPADVLDAGRALTAAAFATGRAERLMAALEPLADGSDRSAYRTLLVDLYWRTTQLAAFTQDRDALNRVGSRGLDVLLQAVSDDDLSVRGRALDVIVAVHPAAATAQLGRLVRERASAVSAATALGHIGTKAAVATLGQLALQPPTPRSRRLGIWALGLVEDGAAAEQLVLRAKSGGTRDRLMALAAIGVSGHVDGLEGAVVGTRSPDTTLKHAAVWALGRVGDPSALPALARLAAHAETLEPRTVSVLVWALARVGTAPARDTLVDMLWRPGLNGSDLIWSALAGAGAANDDHVTATYASMARHTKGFITDPPGILFRPPSPARDQREVDPGVHARIQQLLGRLCAGPNRQRLAELGKALTSSEQLALGPGFGAATTIEFLRPHKDLLVSLVEREGEPLRGVWLPVLARWARVAPADVPVDWVARQANGALIRGEHVGAPLAALETIQRSPTDRAMEALAQTYDPDSLAVGALSALGRTVASYAETHPLVGRLASHPVASVRSSTIAALASLAVPSTFRIVIDALEDPSPLVRSAALERLRRSSVPQARRELSRRQRQPRSPKAVNPL